MINVFFQNVSNSCGVKSRYFLLLFLIIFPLHCNAQLRLALDDNDAPYFVCDSIVMYGVTYKFHSTSLSVKYDNTEKPFEIILYGGYFDIIRYDENLASDVTLFGSFTIKNYSSKPDKPDECFISSSLSVRFSDVAASNSVNEIVCPVKNIPDGLFENKKKLKRVDAYNKIKFLSMNGFFSGCTNLSSVDLKNFDTSEVKYMNSLFSGCSNLDSLDLSNFDTSNVTNMRSMFLGCSILSELDLSNFNTSKVKKMGSMFSFCSNLTTLDLSHFNTGNVTDMTNMFQKCSNLTSLNLSNFDTSNVTDMSCMFYYCNSLTALDLCSFKTGKVKYMNAMFYGCNSLTKLDISHFDTGNVTNMGYMFSDCLSLTALDLSHFNTNNVTDMEEMFNRCSSLIALDLSHFNTGNVTRMDRMFYRCRSLIALDLSNFDTRNVTDMSYMFYECCSLTSLDISHFNTSNVTNMESMFSSCVGLTALDLSHFDTSNVTNMRGMLSSGKGLTTLELKNFDTRNVTDMSYMFFNCGGLTVLDLSNFNTENVTNMGYMFSDCLSLTALDLSHFNTNNVTDMEEMFNRCSSLIALDLSHFNTGNVTRMDRMFYRCRSLIALDLSNFDTRNVTDMSYMFYECCSLTSLDISHFNTNNVTDMQSMFEGCRSLDSLDLTNFNTKNVTNMLLMFCGCRNLTGLDLSSFDTRNVKNMNMMFTGCKNLISLDLSHFDTSNLTNMSGMFDGCSSLVTLELSNFRTENVTNMAALFRGCSSLTTLDLSHFDTGNIMEMTNREEIWEMFNDCSSLKNLSLGSGFKIRKSTLPSFNSVSNLRIYVDADAKPGVDEALRLLGFTEKNGYTTSSDTINAVITNGEIYWATYYNSVASVTLPNNVEAYTAMVEDERVVLKGIEDHVVPKGNAVILKGKLAEMVLDVNTKPKTIIDEDNELNGVDVESSTQEHTYVLSVNEERVGMLDDEYEKIAAHKAYMQRTENGGSKFFPFAGKETEHYLDLSPTDSSYKKIKKNQMVLGYYTSDDISERGYGGLNAGLYRVCMGFSREQMIPFAGNRITNVRFALKDTDIADLKLWIGSNRDKKDLCLQSVAFLKEGWNEVTLNSPYEITGDSIFIGIEYQQSGTRWPISVVSESSELGSSYFYGPYNGADNNEVWLAPDENECLSLQCIVEGDKLPQYDLHTCGLSFSKKYVQANNYYYADFFLRNWGKKNINSATIACEIDGAEIATSTLSSVSHSIKSYFLSFKVGDIPPGRHKLTLRVKDINGVTPEFPSDDAQSLYIKSSSQDMGRDKVMLELYTATWCPYTPRAHKSIAALMKERDDIVLVSNHQSDEMSCDASETYGVFTHSTPMTFYDRFARYGVNSLEYTGIENAKAQPSLAKLGITAEFDENNRQLTIKVNGVKNEEFDAVEEYANLTVLLTEDSITYPQNDFEEDKYIYDYVHNGVLRTSVSEIWGDPVTWTGKEFEKTYTIRLNDEWVKDNMHLVAFLAKPFTGSNYDEIGLVNCNEFLLRNAKLSSGIADICDNAVTIYAKERTIFVKGSYQSMQVYGISGSLAENGKLCEGTYIVKVLTYDGIIVKKIIIR